MVQRKNTLRIKLVIHISNRCREEANDQTEQENSLHVFLKFFFVVRQLSLVEVTGFPKAEPCSLASPGVQVQEQAFCFGLRAVCSKSNFVKHGGCRS